MVAAFGPIPPLPRGTPVGVRQAKDPAGALGVWHCTDHVAICIPDATRSLDLIPALTALQSRLPNAQFIIGLGLHRRMSASECASFAAFAPAQSNPDDWRHTAVVDGIPGTITRAVAEADWSIGVGVAELHQYAGFSGGHKGVSVGCGGRPTIAALHERARVLSDGVRLGQVQGNPFRAAVDKLGMAARCKLALAQTSDGQWLCGDPKSLVQEAARLIQPWEWTSQLASEAVLRVPESKAVSFYQASRALTYLALSPHPAVVPGGLLTIDAACSEGLGSESGFVQALQSCPPPWTELLQGPAPTGPGAQRAVVLALAAQKYRIAVRNCRTAAALCAVGIDAKETAPAKTPTALIVSNPFTRLPQFDPARSAHRATDDVAKTKGPPTKSR